MISYGKVYLTPNIPPQARQWRNNQMIWRYCRQNTLISTAGQKRWLERIEGDPTIKMFGISVHGTNEQIGVCGLTSISLVNGSAEFSLYIAPKFQGNGYSKDALMALLNHGFNEWRLERIWGEVFEYNVKALAAFKKIGFKQEGILRHTYFKEGKYIDSIIVSMLKDEFHD